MYPIKTMDTSLMYPIKTMGNSQGKCARYKVNLRPIAHWSSISPALSYANVSQVRRRIATALNDNSNGKSRRYRHGIVRVERPAPLCRFNRLSSASRRLGNSIPLSSLKLAVCALRSRVLNRSRTNENGKSIRFKGRAIVCALTPMSSYSRLPPISGLAIEQVHPSFPQTGRFSFRHGHAIVRVLSSLNLLLYLPRLKNTMTQPVSTGFQPLCSTSIDPPSQEITPLPPSTFRLPLLNDSPPLHIQLLPPRNVPVIQHDQLNMLPPFNAFLRSLFRYQIRCYSLF